MFKKSLIGAFLSLLAATSLFALAGLAGAGEGIHIDHAWIRLLPGDRPAGAYFVLENQTGHALTLTGISTSAFGAAMMHRSDGGSMQSVQAVDVPAGEKLRFSPGGYHVMLMPPHDPMQPGDRVSMTLEFADGSTSSADFLIQGAAAIGWPESEHTHQHMHH